MAEHNKPWWLDLTKEIGGLGIVLVMLFGLYLLGDKYLADMQQTWNDIHDITKIGLEHERKEGERSEAVINRMMTLFDEELSSLRQRVNELENARTD